MENKIKFTDKAKKDLEESVKFYENRKIGLGKDFLNTIQIKSLQIQSKPESNPTGDDGIKKAKVKVFPFYIFAIWHVARLPFARRDRTKDIDE